MTGALAIEARQLTKRYGDVAAVDGFDLAVPVGTVVSLLGPNGAGKTTVVRMLATLARPTSGTAAVFGHDIAAKADAVRSVISLTGQFAAPGGEPDRTGEPAADGAAARLRQARGPAGRRRAH